jgi:hypothetical protein
MASTLTRRNAEISLARAALAPPTTSQSRKPTVNPRPRRSFAASWIDASARSVRAAGWSGRRPLYTTMPVGPARSATRRDRPERRGAQHAERAEPGKLVLRPLQLMPPRVLLIGSSTGGPQALNLVVSNLHAVIDQAPVLITQHMPPTFTAILAEHLTRASGRPAHEAVDGEPVLAGKIYVAPGGRHMRVPRRDGEPVIALQTALRSISASRRSTRRSPRRPWGELDLALVLTGMAPMHQGRLRSPPSSPRRSLERGVGHARLGRPCGTGLGGAGARSDRAEDRAHVRGGPSMTPDDYDFLRRLLKERSGLVLAADKQYLVESRLLPVARRAGFMGLGDLVLRLKGPAGEPLVVEVVEAMTTNASFFFRDKIPFEHSATRSCRRSWPRARRSAAPASGARPPRPREPHSLAMSLKEMAATSPAGASRSSPPTCPTRCWRRPALQPVRGAARAADPAVDQVSARPRSRPSCAPWCRSGSHRRRFPSRRVGRGVLSKQTDLFRP